MPKSRVKHPFEPIMDQQSRVLILGSFPSVKTRQSQFYYAHPQNLFWKVLAKVYDEEILDRKEFCLKHHIALWDVIFSCDIENSSDISISHVKCNDIDKIIQNTSIHTIFTNGLKASKLYEKYIHLDLPHISLPSTSSANARYSLEQLVEEYSMIKKVIDEKD